MMLMLAAFCCSLNVPFKVDSGTEHWACVVQSGFVKGVSNRLLLRAWQLQRKPKPVSLLVKRNHC